MINNIIYSLVFALFYSVMACQDDLPSPQDAKATVAYIDEFQNKETIRFSVNDNGGSTSLTPRISQLSNGEAYIIIEASQKVLDDYNAKNNANYKMLPEHVYNLVNTKTGEKGKSLKVNLENNDFGANIRVEVGDMLDKEGNKLPVADSYAVPVALSSASADRYIKTSDSRTGILILDREFTTGVLRLKGRLGAYMIDEANDIKFSDFTAQISFKIDDNGNGRIRENTGLLYPNSRTSNGSFYQTLYGNGLTLFTTAGGKVGLNQPEFEEFKFEPNKWYHLSISFKVENEIPYFRLYLNGKLAYSGPWTGKIEDWGYVYIGNSSFSGYIRELRLWNKALTESEINSTLYFANPDDENLVLYMPLNDVTKFENVATKTKGLYTYKLGSGANSGNTDFNSIETFP